jgi:hypothetical protein
MKPNDIVITVPLGWDAKQDADYYLGEYGDDLKYVDIAMNSIGSNFKKLEKVVSHGVKFQMKINGMIEFDVVEHLSFGARVEVFRRLVHRDDTTPEYRARFYENLNHCLAVERLRDEIIKKYVFNPKEVMFYELVNLDTWIATTYLGLSESLVCEHEDDYKSLLIRDLVCYHG